MAEVKHARQKLAVVLLAIATSVLYVVLLRGFGARPITAENRQLIKENAARIEAVGAKVDSLRVWADSVREDQ